MTEGPDPDSVFDAYSSMPNAGVALLEADGRILRANSHFLTLFNLEADQIVFANYFDRTHPGDSRQEYLNFAKLVEGSEQSYVQEKRLVLERSDAGHYAGILHVESMVMLFGDGIKAFYLALMQELKVYRHFKPDV